MKINPETRKQICDEFIKFSNEYVGNSITAKIIKSHVPQNISTNKQNIWIII